MSRVTLRERTIQFFEVVLEKSGEQVRCQQLDFPSALLALGRAAIDERKWEGPSQTLIGTVQSIDDTSDHLLLHRVKDSGEWLSVMDLTTGDWRELESKASEGYLDTTAISFMDFGNVVALMLGATSAPSHKSLEHWLNALKLFGDQRLIVRPLLSRAEIERLKTAEGASRVEIRIGSHKTEALAHRDGRLAKFLRRATEDFGDVNVTVTISVPRGGARLEDRRRLLDDLRDLDEVMPGSADVAKAKLVFSDVGGAEYAQLAEFVEHHITAKRRVAAVDEQGNSIRLTEALRIIRDVAIDHEEELRLAADAPGG